MARRRTLPGRVARLEGKLPGIADDQEGGLDRPIAYRCFSVRRKICPRETAGELSVYSSSGFSARTSKAGPARSTLVTPSSLVT